LREPYHDPRELGEWILEDLTELIERLFPEEQQPDEFAAEAAQHDTFAQGRTGVYVRRQEYFDRLDAHVNGEGPPLVVLGESGSGKSALLANWYTERQACNTDDITLVHFIGSTPHSSDAMRLMQRMMHELKHRFDLPEDVPSDPDRVGEVFEEWLTSAVGLGRIVLVLDGLDQLDDRDSAPDLDWLPAVLPKQVRLIVSTLPGRSLEAARRRNWEEMVVQPLTLREREKLIEEFLAGFSRRLDTPRLNRIAATDQCSNPLFLRAVLDELRQFGEHERLDKVIEHYLSAPDAPALYQRILQRWGDDFGDGLVQISLSLLWSSRRGLTETELLDLLGHDQNPLPRAAWTPFFLAAESSLIGRGGRLDFFHSYLREAVERRCLATKERRQSCHRALAHYFLQRPAKFQRTLEELPWQWMRAEAWEELKNLLTGMGVFLCLWSEERGKRDLQTYWLALAPHFDPCQAYSEALNQWETEAAGLEDFATALKALASFHQVRAEYGPADAAHRRVLSIYEEVYGPDHPEVAWVLSNLAVLLRETSRPSEAETFIRRALAIHEKVSGPNDPAVAIVLNNLGHLLKTTERFDEAASMYQRSLSILEQHHGERHPDVAVCLNNLAALQHATGRPEEAEALMRRALAILERRHGAQHPMVGRVLNNLAAVLETSNRWDEAEAIYRRSLAIHEQVYGPEHPDFALSLHNLGHVLESKGRPDDAEAMYRRALAVAERHHHDDHPQVTAALDGVIRILRHSDRLPEAEPMIRRALAVDEQSYGADSPRVAERLKLLADILQMTRRAAEAQSVYRRVLAICSQPGTPASPWAAGALNNMAQSLVAARRSIEAEPLFRRAIEILEQSDDADGLQLASVTYNLARLLEHTDRDVETEELMRRALALREESLGPDHPSVAKSLNDLAQFLQRLNRLGEAEPLMRRALAIWEQSAIDPLEVATGLNNLAYLLHATNQTAEAEPLFDRALEILENAHGSQHPRVATGLTNLASVYQASDRLPEAEAMLRQALEIDEQAFGGGHPRVARDLYTLAGLLHRANRTSEAEPLGRRAVEILLSVSAEAGGPHGQLQTVLTDYAGLLLAMGKNKDEVEQQVNALFDQFDIS
jgi:tetratricopeptide (TPR) repeat protein